MFRFLIRAMSFVGKELTAILRQPRLIVLLAIGPFLIMLLFGLSFPDQNRNLRTTFVVEEESEFTGHVETLAEQISSPIIFEGVENDRDIALAQLALGQTDLVIVVPPNPSETIRNNERAEFRVFHNEVDPFQVGYVQFVGRLFTDIVNRRTLESITAEGQEDAASVQVGLEAAINNAAAVRAALESNDRETATEKKAALDQNLEIVRLALGGTLAVLSGVDGTFGDGEAAGNQEIISALDAVSTRAESLGSLDSENLDFNGKAAEAAVLEEKLTELNDRLTEFRSLDPAIMVSPFTSTTSGLSELQFTPIGFFAPAVLVLLLQHIAITFAALSIVRERSSGIMESFSVAPISAFEALIGKYLSYLFFEALLAGAITGLVVWVLRIPMLGLWGHYALAIFLLLFASLGLGFLVSLVSETDTQAAQYSMLLLLASIFFSGFLLDLRLMAEPLRFLPWTLPATYSIQLLRDVMLRGYALPIRVVLGIVAMGIGLFALNWLLLRRQMTPAKSDD